MSVVFPFAPQPGCSYL